MTVVSKTGLSVSLSVCLSIHSSVYMYLSTNASIGLPVMRLGIALLVVKLFIAAKAKTWGRDRGREGEI